MIASTIEHRRFQKSAPAPVSPDLLRDLHAITPLDPLHMPLHLAPIRAIAAIRPDLVQLACFDTGFHYTMPPHAASLCRATRWWAPR
jgi:acetate kinase